MPWQISLKKCESKRQKTTTTKTQGQQPTQINKRRVLVETENESVVSLGYIRPGMGAKAHRPAISPRDRSRNPYKSPPTFFFFFNLSYVAISAYCTWASLSSSLHVLLSEFASRSYSTPHKTAVIASLCHIQHHTRWPSLFLSINLNFT